jgi:3-hydroxyisobutyrate dehydrogenase-like beta-hydroxyacid dehydrogenase
VAEQLRVGIVGGLGVMASPMAKHWSTGQADEPKVVRVHDRGNAGEARDRARAAWRQHGAEAVSTLGALVGDGDLDGVIVCAGKNGDDVPIISELTRHLSKYPGKFICHMSTVSTGFADAATAFANQSGVTYVNYPLTGGALGAQNGTMLILAGGDKNLFERLSPALSRLGKPRYFGARPSSGAEVKFIGHLMVFNGFMGIGSGVAIHSAGFQNGKFGGPEQEAFFDFLNTGAGGTRQWDVMLRYAVKDNQFKSGFSLRYAAVDAIYTAHLCRERKVSLLCTESALNAALVFSYGLSHLEEGLATQAGARELLADRSKALDTFVIKHSAPRGDLAHAIQKAIDSLPEDVRSSVLLNPIFAP